MSESRSVGYVIFKLSGLWLHANFRRLWAGQSASLFASELTYVVLPLIAVVFLEATPIQMGVIGAMGGVPALAGIFLSVWVDRRSRGPILVMVDVGRMIVLLAIPVSYVMGVLTIEILYAVSLGIGGMSMLFEIAYRSFLPSVVKNTQIVEANSKLELANTGAVAVGPGLGGVLVEIVVAPFAVLSSVVMYVVSAVMFKSLRVNEIVAEVARDADGNSESVLQGIKIGFGFFKGNRLLVGIGAASITLGVFGAAYDTIYILYLVRTHDFSAGMIGLIFSVNSIDVLDSSFISSWITTRIGVGRTLLFGFVFLTIGGFIVPAAEGSRYFVYVLILVAEITFVLGIVIWNIGQVSLRQAVTPGSLLGRVNSILIVTGRASVPVGALIGGYLGEEMGLRGAIYVFAAGISAGAIWLVLLGFWNLKEMPEVDDPIIT